MMHHSKFELSLTHIGYNAIWLTMSTPHTVSLFRAAGLEE